MWDTNECIEPTKTQFLSGYSVRPMTGSSARPHTMCLWHPQNRVINIQAKNSDSLRAWMRAAEKHILIANGLQNSRPEWEENTSSCTLCDKSFGIFTRPHHCRNCGRCVCSTCNAYKWRLESHGGMKLCKICKKCYQELKANYSIQRDLLPDASAEPISPSVRGALARSDSRRRSQGKRTTTNSAFHQRSTSDLQRELRSVKKKK